MATGKVKWFNNAKGYGFILADEGGEDLFAHFSSIQMDGYKTLKAGQSVGYELVAGPKGNHAVNIREVDQAESTSEQPQGSASEAAEVVDEVEDEDATADSIGNH